MESHDDGGGGLLGLLFGVGGFAVVMVILVVAILASWKLFTKAGKPGWASIIPLYNQWVMMEIVGLPGVAMLAFFVPFVNFLFGLYVTFRLAKVFGKDMLFTIGLLVPPINIICFLILAFGADEYLGPEAAN